MSHALNLPLPILLLIQLHLLDYPHANKPEYDHNVFNPRTRGLKERTKLLEEIAFFLVGRLEGGANTAKTILSKYPCSSPSETLAFRTAFSKYLEALRHAAVFPTSKSTSNLGTKIVSKTKELQKTPERVAWWWKDVLVRKSLLEECGGEKFERLLLSLSTHALFRMKFLSTRLDLDNSTAILHSQPTMYASLLQKYLQERRTWAREASLILVREAELEALKDHLNSRKKSGVGDKISTSDLLVLAEVKYERLLHAFWMGNDGNEALDFLMKAASVEIPGRVLSDSTRAGVRLISSEQSNQENVLSLSASVPASSVQPQPLPIAAAHHPAFLKKLRKPIFDLPKTSNAVTNTNIPPAATSSTPSFRAPASAALIERVNAEQKMRKALLEAVGSIRKVGEEMKHTIRVLEVKRASKEKGREEGTKPKAMRAAGAQSGVRAQASAGVVGKGKGVVNPSKKVAMGRGKENEKAAVPVAKGKESDKERGKPRDNVQEKDAARAGPEKDKLPFELNLWEPRPFPLELNFNTKPTPELLDSFGLNTSKPDTEEGKALEARIEEIRSELVFVKKMREPLPVARELEPRLPWREKEMKVSKIPKGVRSGGLDRATMKANDDKERLELKTGIRHGIEVASTKQNPKVLEQERSNQLPKKPKRNSKPRQSIRLSLAAHAKRQPSLFASSSEDGDDDDDDEEEVLSMIHSTQDNSLSGSSSTTSNSPSSSTSIGNTHDNINTNTNTRANDVLYPSTPRYAKNKSKSKTPRSQRTTVKVNRIFTGSTSRWRDGGTGPMHMHGSTIRRRPPKESFPGLLVEPLIPLPSLVAASESFEGLSGEEGDGWGSDHDGGGGGADHDLNYDGGYDQGIVDGGKEALVPVGESQSENESEEFEGEGESMTLRDILLGADRYTSMLLTADEDEADEGNFLGEDKDESFEWA